MEELLHSILIDAYLSDYMSVFYPDESDSMDLLLEGGARVLAADSLYLLCVAESISVTEGDLLHFYETMQEPVIVPERRVFRLALARGEEQLGQLRSATAEGPERARAFLESLPPPPGHTYSDGGDGLAGATEPLRFDQVPASAADSLFALSESDTIDWHGPFRLRAPEGYLFARLVRVIPEHRASMEELRDEIERRVRSNRESERFTRWMVELESRHGLVINEEVLGSLPSDPGLWSDLPD